MSTHTAAIQWPDPAAPIAPFTPETYTRDHTVVWGTGQSGQVSAAPEYRGNPTLPNPEELLVGALCSCHMLTFLAVAARKRHVVLSYTDNAVGTLAKDDRSLLCVTEVVLHPVVTFETPVDAETLAQLHEAAHRGCFIANSVRTAVRVEA